jgi:predicted O-linked N-acetylglucosamine transferase (SPINDLY family)
MHKLFFWINWHAGDLVLTRPLVRQVLNAHDVQIVYGCWRNQAYIVEDLPIKVIVDSRDDPKIATSDREQLLHLCPEGYLPIHLWVGLDTNSLSHNWESMVKLYNRQVESQGIKSLQIHSHYVPMVDFAPVEVEIAHRSIFVENGATRSKHSDYRFDIEALAKRFPRFNFYCTADPQSNRSNVYDCSMHNLRTLSSISNRCVAIMGKGSGPFCSTLTEVNRYKPRAILRYHPLNVVHDIWDYPGNPMQYLETDEDVEQFLSYVERREVTRVESNSEPSRVAFSVPFPFRESEAARLHLIIDQFLRNPSDKEYLSEIVRLQRQLVEIWLSMPCEHLEYAYRGAWGKLTSRFLKLGTWELEASRQPPIAENKFQDSGKYASQFLCAIIAAMLTRFPRDFPYRVDLRCIPDWLREDLYRYLRQDGGLFKKPKAAKLHFEQREWVLGNLAECLTQEANNPYCKELSIAAMNLDLRPRNMAVDQNPRIAQEAYGNIIESALRASDFKVNHTFLPFDSVRKARIGVLLYDLALSADSYFNLPLIEFLDEAFDLRVYILSDQTSPLTDYCLKRGVRLARLSDSVKAQAEVLREEDLDVLVLSNNYAIDQRFSPLASTRVARYQLLANSPFTSGTRCMDGVLCGENDCQQAEAFTEKIDVIAGSGSCFSMADLSPPPITAIDRAQLAIPSGATVLGTLVCALDCTVEMVETWCEILAQVPNSVLFMLPFSPDRSSLYEKREFVGFVGSIFQSRGLDPSRLIVLAAEPYPTYDELPNYLCHVDVFLDAYPVSSRNDTILAFRLGRPVITRRGHYPHARVAANLIAELSPELGQYLVANTDLEYVQLATMLGRSREQRIAFANYIRQTLPNSSLFNSRLYGQRLSKTLHEILGKIG